jgi:hypothetical protein
LPISHALTILLAGSVGITTAIATLLVYWFGIGSHRASDTTSVFVRFKRLISPKRSATSSSREDMMRFNRETESNSINDVYGREAIPRWATGAAETGRWPLSILYRRIGEKQKIAGVAFVFASIAFLILSVKFGSLVLEIDSVVSFVVAAVLFLKESRSKVQSRVLSAVVLSLGATIAELSSRAGSRFVYAPLGKEMSDIAIVDSPFTTDIKPPSDGFKIVPPGMGLAALFARETDGAPITLDSLTHLLRLVVRENFGLAEGVEVMSTDSRVEIVLLKPAVYCTCQRDESKSTGVVGCAVSSFLAVLYTYGTQRAITLDRCATDSDSGTWKVSMNFLAKPS